jgi:hypothetical protein
MSFGQNAESSFGESNINWKSQYTVWHGDFYKESIEYEGKEEIP